MIPADHITFNDDGTAWLVVYRPPDSAPAQWEQDDKPCDACGGGGRDYGSPGPGAMRTDCTDGRHTFDIEVAIWDPPQPGASVTHRVSFVPGVVLEIMEPNHGSMTCIEIADPENGYPHELFIDGRYVCDLTLPPAAKPSMWAVKLRVVSQ